MPSIIYFHNWDGGGGFNDTEELIGYCKEEPKDILKNIAYKNVSVYKYLGHHTPIDCRFPNNVSGLVINEITYEQCKKLGINIIGSFEDLNISQSCTSYSRDDKILEQALSKHANRLKYFDNPKIIHDIELMINTIQELF